MRKNPNKLIDRFAKIIPKLVLACMLAAMYPSFQLESNNIANADEYKEIIIFNEFAGPIEHFNQND